MFKLDKEIDLWCKDIIYYNCAGKESLDELKDHLWCLVEAEQGKGADDRTAFSRAIKQMGDSDLISSEYAKNTSMIRKIVAFDRKLPRLIDRHFSAKQIVVFNLLFSIFIAAMILLGSTLFPEHREAITTWMIALWFIPAVATAASPSAREAECAWFRRLAGRS